MRIIIVILLLVSLAWRASSQEMREWTDRAGRKFSAAIIAVDAWRATFALPDRSKAVVPLTQLSVADMNFVNTWRAQNPAAPLVDPQKLAPWPAEAGAADIEVKVSGGGPVTVWAIQRHSDI